MDVTERPAPPAQSGRWAALVGGGALVVLGLTRRSLPGLALALAGGALIIRGATTSPGADTADDGAAPLAAGPPDEPAPVTGRIRVEKAVTIARAPADLYRFWRDFANLPQFMKHLEVVHPTGHGRSHWVARAPLGKTVSWDAEITEERENERIAWRSLPLADVANSGEVRFTQAPDGRGTEVHVALEYQPPAGALGVAVAKLLGEEPNGQVEDDLRRFKQLMEAGEVATVDGQPAGRPAPARGHEGP